MSEHLERIDDFVNQLKQSQQAFVLSSESGLLIAQSEFNDERDALLIWSSSEMAQQQCKGEWQHFNVIEINFDDVLDLLPHLKEDELLIGLDLSDEQIAIELEADSLLEALSND
ncbi:MAG: DUF2750 domain-containing protein [Pseudoalteromonas spongiae]|uniref:DUF2750 domain-containing protein n=1 Tax=Pseudoalteromonas sp. T1lg24 TaxID=2077099 RepID=UPI000CF67564|nr:DUF2750 domain-containing protein [Pseudoalteromonas sp. T1lg24]MEC8326178.1 DUF2750 domain-containing protein [Pseudomonadota bacterium]